MLKWLTVSVCVWFPYQSYISTNEILELKTNLNERGITLIKEFFKHVQKVFNFIIAFYLLMLNSFVDCSKKWNHLIKTIIGKYCKRIVRRWNVQCISLLFWSKYIVLSNKKGDVENNWYFQNQIKRLKSYLLNYRLC